jgi:hypothetical protein
MTAFWEREWSGEGTAVDYFKVPSRHSPEGTKEHCHIKRLVAGVRPRRPGFDPGSGQVGFVVDKVALPIFIPPNSPSSYHPGQVQ